jgi:hypothetical protein
MPRCDRRLRGTSRKPSGIWPPPDSAFRPAAVHAATPRQLVKALKRLQTEQPKSEEKFKWIALESEIYGEIIRRNASGTDSVPEAE